MTKKEGPDKLDLAAREAREHGLTYGKYMAVRETLNPAEHKSAAEYAAKWLRQKAARKDGPVITVQKATTRMGTGKRAIRIFDLWREGMHDAQIGEVLGIPKTTVYNWRNAMGIPGNWGRVPDKKWILVKLPDGAYHAERKGENQNG